MMGVCASSMSKPVYEITATTAFVPDGYSSMPYAAWLAFMTKGA